MKICQTCKTSWDGDDTPDYCPACLTPITNWHGLYLAMDRLCKQQQERAKQAESRLAAVFGANTALVCALDRIHDILSGEEYMKHADKGIDEIINAALEKNRALVPEESQRPSGSDSPK